MSREVAAHICVLANIEFVGFYSDKHSAIIIQTGDNEEVHKWTLTRSRSCT